jgi:hypothetical protein
MHAPGCPQAEREALRSTLPALPERPTPVICKARRAQTPFASAAILRVAASHAAATRTPLSSIPKGRERGLERQRQVLARLDGFAYPHSVPVESLDCSPAPPLNVSCVYLLPFTHLVEVVEREVPVL